MLLLQYLKLPERRAGIGVPYVNFAFNFMLDIIMSGVRRGRKTESIISIDLVIYGDQGKGVFISSIKLNAKFT